MYSKVDTFDLLTFKFYVEKLHLLHYDFIEPYVLKVKLLSFILSVFSNKDSHIKKDRDLERILQIISKN